MPVLTKINTNVIPEDAVTAAKIPAGAVAADIGANGIGLSELDNTATGITADYHKVPVLLMQLQEMLLLEVLLLECLYTIQPLVQFNNIMVLGLLSLLLQILPLFLDSSIMIMILL